FAFVEMETDDQEEAAIAALDGTELMGRNLKVNKARPREERGGRR
ncbi:MAG: RNA-binding protein, partial [Trichodesmium sp.]